MVRQIRIIISSKFHQKVGWRDKECAFVAEVGSLSDCKRTWFIFPGDVLHLGLDKSTKLSNPTNLIAWKLDFLRFFKYKRWKIYKAAWKMKGKISEDIVWRNTKQKLPEIHWPWYCYKPTKAWFFASTPSTFWRKPFGTTVVSSWVEILVPWALDQSHETDQVERPVELTKRVWMLIWS